MRKLLLLIVISMAAISLAVTEITFWYALSGVSGESIKSIVDAFNASQSDITVKMVYSGSYADTAQKITAALAANALPNGGIIPAGPIFTGAQDNYVLLDYMLADPEFDMDDFYPALWDYCNYQGKICAIPFNISTPILYYNKDLMIASGLDPENPPQNWEELLAAAMAITKDTNGDGVADIWGVDMADTPWIFKAFLLQNETAIIDVATMTPLFDNAQGIEAAQFWKRLIDEKAMPVGQHSLAEKMFLGGTLGFYLGSSNKIGRWLGTTSFEFGATFLPAGVVRAVPIGGAVAVLFPNNQKEDEATYRLIKWLTTPEYVAKFAMETGYLPTRKSALELPETQQFMESTPMWRVAFEQLTFAFSYWHFNEMGTMDTMIAEALEKIERGVSSPADAMRELTGDLKAEIKANLE